MYVFSFHAWNAETDLQVNPPLEQVILHKEFELDMILGSSEVFVQDLIFDPDTLAQLYLVR